MSSAVLCLVTVALGVDVGWQRLPDGGMEYIIQIEPHMLEMLKAGEQIQSDIPPHLRAVRSYRITVGTDELPREEVRELGPEAPAVPEVGVPAPADAQPPAPETIAEAEPAVPEVGPSEFPSAEVPRTLTLPEDTRRIPDLGEKAAAFVNQPVAEVGPPPTQKEAEELDQTEPQEPWLPLTLALAGLFGSFGGMLYVGWIAWDYRRQYQALLAQVIEGGEGLVAAGESAIDSDPISDAGHCSVGDDLP